METSVIDKIVTIIKYFCSSFMGIELLLIMLLAFTMLYFVLKKDNKIIKIIYSMAFILFLVIVIICFNDYVVSSIDYFIKAVMKYYYFPSVGLYFIIVLGVTILFIISILSKVFTKFEKISIYILSFFTYLFFIGFISFVLTNKITLTLDLSLYSNNVILSLVQLSNLILFVWVIVILIHKLFIFFKKKFD